MMHFEIPRRSFLRATTAGIVATQLPTLTQSAHAIEPIQRTAPQLMKLSLAAYSFNDVFKEGKMDLAGFVDYCAELGIGAAELTQYYFPKEVTKESVLDLKRHAHFAGVDISGGAIGNNFTVDPGEKLDEQMDYVTTWIHHYADLGAPVIRIFAGKPAAGLDEDVAVERVIAAMKTACKTAAERGVILGIENHDFTTHIDRLLQVVAAVDSPWFGINFDSGNLHHSDAPYADMARIAPYAVNAQIKVKVHQTRGHLDADLPRTIDILRDAKYSGYVVLEYEEDDPYDNIPKYAEQLQKLIDA